MYSDISPGPLALVKLDQLLFSGLPAISILIVIGIMIASSILGNWIASQAVAKEKATIGRAGMTFVTQLVWSLIVAVLFGLAFFYLERNRADPILVSIGVLACVIVFIAMAISIPMQIYEITALRAVGFNLLSGFIGLILSNAALLVFGGAESLKRPPISFDQILSAIKTNRRPEISAAELRQRQAALIRRHEQLEIRRKYLPANDRKAFLDYERDRIGYERDVEQLKADSAP